MRSRLRDMNEIETEIRTPPSLLMYIAGFIVTYSGIYAANLSLGDQSFAALVTMLTAVGFVASYLSRIQNIPARNVVLPALIICCIIVGLSLFVDPADSMAGTLLQRRLSGCPDYQWDNFRHELSRRFEIRESLSLQGGQRILLMASRRS